MSAGTLELELIGAPYSVYTRIVRLVLAELELPCKFTKLDIFGGGQALDNYRQRHPFGKIPLLVHGAHEIYETDAIVTYLCALKPDVSLLPVDPLPKARCIQIMRIMDNYGFRDLVFGIYVAEREDHTEEPVSTKQIENARNCLNVLSGFHRSPYFGGKELTTADLWVYPMLRYLQLSRSGPQLLQQHPNLTDWLEFMSQRPSIIDTRFPAETSLAESQVRP